MRDQPSREEGTSILLVALSMVLLLGVGAVVIDVGNARQVQRQAQAAVDAAALAAVVDYDGSSGTEPAATARAVEYVEDNGFPSSSVSSVDFSTNPSGDRCVAVTITDYPVDTALAPVIGSTFVNVGAMGKACSTPGGAGPALFAGGQSCSDVGKAFKVSGNDNLVEGDIVSNNDVLESGGPNVRTGNASYLNNPLDVGPVPPSRMWQAPVTQLGSALPFPAVPFGTLADYAPGGTFATASDVIYYSYSGDTEFDGSIPAGVHYVDGKVSLKNGVTVAPDSIGGEIRRGATIVATGLIEISDDNLLITPYEKIGGVTNRLTFYAGWQEKSGPDRCDSETLKMSGNCNRFDGIAYVPDGKFRVSGEGNGHDYAPGSGQCSSLPGTPDFRGSVQAYAIEISGNYSLFRSDSLGGGGQIYLAE